MRNRIITGMAGSFIASACIGLAATVTYNTAGNVNWSSKTVGAADAVTIAAGSGGTTVTLDQDATMTSLTANNSNLANVGGKLLINQNRAFSASSFIAIGSGSSTNVANITQSTGSVSTATLYINRGGTGNGAYDLSGGTVSVTGAANVNNLGRLNISGGTFTAASMGVTNGGNVSLTGGTLNMDGVLLNNGTVTVNGGTYDSSTLAQRTLSGSGTINVQSGTFRVNGNGATGTAAKVTLDTALFEASGGAVDLGTVWLGVSAAAEFKVIGDGATINMLSLNQMAGRGTNGTFNFVFDENGVSTINISTYAQLSLANIVVNGSAYTNGFGTFKLFDSSNLASLIDTNNISIAGFDAKYKTYITQDIGTGDVSLTLIPEPATLGLFVISSAGLLLMRRIRMD